MDSFPLYVSNQMDVLAKRLHENISRKERPLRCIIVVPSSIYKDYLNHFFMACDKRITTGYKVLTLSSAIDYLLRSVEFSDKRMHSFVSNSLLALHLELLLFEYLEGDKLQKDVAFNSIREFLNCKKKSEVEKRVRALSKHLAKEFSHIGLYANSSLEGFLEKRSYQAILFEEIFSKWDFPYKLFSSSGMTPVQDLDLDVHLFGFTHIPNVYQEFFFRIGEFFEINQYFLNPCMEYWGDVVSEKARYSLTDFYEKKGVAQEEVDTLDSYLKNRNVLLAHFGYTIKEQLNFYLDKGYDLQENYFSQGDETLLKRIKKDILTLTPTRDEKEERSFDESMQVFSCPSKRREVETLYNTILKLTDNKNVLPSDILVLSPDLSSYFPYIYETFMAEGSEFHFTANDLTIESQSSFLRGLLEVFALKDARFEKRDILKLFAIPSFVRKLGLEKEEVARLKEIIQRAPVRFAFDKDHKSKILGEPVVREEGTWKYALHKLLLGLSVERVDSDDLTFLPDSFLKMSDAELIGVFIKLVKELYRDASYLKVQKLTLEKWLVVTSELAEKYFFIEEKDTKEIAGHSYYLEQLKTLYQLVKKCDATKVSFNTIYFYLRNALRKKSASFSSGASQGVVFANLNCENIAPAKILFLLGLDENSFPRKEEALDLDEINKDEMDFFPTASSEDRTCLLLSLLQAKDHLYMSYCCKDPIDDKPVSLCYLVTELLKYIEQNFTFENQEVSDALVCNVPSFSFDKTINKENYSKRSFELARSYYDTKKEKRHFFPEFHKEMKPLEDEAQEIRVSTKDLFIFAKNPLRSFFNNSLGVYLEEEENLEEALEKEFTLSPLDKTILRSEAIEVGEEKVLNAAKALGSLPSGMFQELAVRGVKEEVETLSSLLEMANLKEEEIFSIYLEEGVSEIQEIEGGVVFPALKLRVGSTMVTIVGEIDNVTKKGLLHLGKTDTASIMQLLPKALIYSLLDHDFPKELFLVQKAKEFPLGFCREEHLHEFVKFFLIAKKEPCPFTPKWIEALLLKGEDVFRKAVKQAFSATYETGYVDPYMKWLVLLEEKSNASVLAEKWGETFKQVFSPLLISLGKKLVV